MNVRIYRFSRVYWSMLRIEEALSYPDYITARTKLHIAAIAMWAGKAARAFTLSRDPEETVWLVAAGEGNLVSILSHESLHHALNRLGMWDESKALDRYRVCNLALGKRTNEDGL